MARQVQDPRRRSQPVRLRDQESRARVGPRPGCERPRGHMDRPGQARSRSASGSAAGRPCRMSAPAPRRTGVPDPPVHPAVLGQTELNSLTGEEITVWEQKLHDAEGMSRSTANDARSLLHTILGDAAAAKPPVIPFNPAVRPRNRGRRTGRRCSTAARSARGRRRWRCCSSPNGPHCWRAGR